MDIHANSDQTNPARVDPRTVDPRNPEQKFYSGITSMTLAILSLFVATGLLAPIALVFGIVAIVTGNKRGNIKLRGEGWFGTVFAGLILLGWFLVMRVM